MYSISENKKMYVVNMENVYGSNMLSSGGGGGEREKQREKEK